MGDGNFEVESVEILVVDDHSENLKTLSTVLNRDKYKVRFAQSGPQALRSVKTKPPNLILLDIRMPEMDGYEVCRRLKQDKISREIPIIFISAMDEPINKVKAFEVGGVDYIEKPFNSAEVIARINTHLKLRQLQKELQKHSQTLEKQVDVRTVQLTESRENYSRLVENLPVGIYRTTPDKNGHFLMANPAMAKMLGYETTEALLGIPVADLYQNSADRRLLLEKLIKNGFVRNEELEIQNRTGKSLLVTVTAQLIRSQDGKPLYVDGVIADITERKKLESQLQQAHKMESIGTLAGGIAHDFNNILGIVLGCTDLCLFEVSKESPIHEHLSQIRQASIRAKALVKQILTFSRQNEQERVPIEPSIIIKEALKMLRSSLPSTTEIKQNIKTDTGAVLADPIQIHQILMNLCTNAAHAMQKNGGLLSVSLCSADMGVNSTERHPNLIPGRYVNLTISDTGHGMLPDTLGRIFDPYFTTKELGDGTGMGLAIVHGIVNSYGGMIKVESKPGEGTTFQIFLPRLDLTDESETAEDVSNLPTGKERIFLIDNEEILLKAIQMFLERLGYEVVTSSSSIHAVETFRSDLENFDLVITNYTMPKMTGLELAREIINLRSDIPIILCTGSSELIKPKDAEVTGIREIIMKPVVMSELAVIIRKLLQQGDR